MPLPWSEIGAVSTKLRTYSLARDRSQQGNLMIL